MKRKKSERNEWTQPKWWLWAIVLAGALTAQAHFMLLYSPETVFALGKPARLNLWILFTHPFDGNDVMTMGRDEQGRGHPPQAFGVMTRPGGRDGKRQKTDLLPRLVKQNFSANQKSGEGYALKAYPLHGLGDFVFYLDPAPYWEPAEGTWIRHVTKLIVNRGGVGTCWDQPVGKVVPCEIMPLSCPYALWTGNLFRGVVLRDGKPVSHARIEVSYLNHAVTEKGLMPKARFQAPHAALACQTIFTDQQGVFSYALPKSGWWGFAALDLGDDHYHGKPLELGALLWVQANDMQRADDKH